MPSFKDPLFIAIRRRDKHHFHDVTVLFFSSLHKEITFLSPVSLPHKCQNLTLLRYTEATEISPVDGGEAALDLPPPCLLFHSSTIAFVSLRLVNL
jgi:hypothetical protein